MELQITPEQEAKLATLAARLDRSPGDLVLDTVLKIAEEEDRFRAAVRKGLEYADRGEFIEEAEMDARVERMLSRGESCVGHLPPLMTWRASVIIFTGINRVGRNRQ